MSYIVLSIISSVLIGNMLMLFHRFKKSDIVVIFLGNYFVASLFSLLNSKKPITAINILELSFAAFAGFLFLYNFYVYHKNIQLNGLSLSVGAMRMAVVIPIIISLIVFSDPISLTSGIGIFVILISFWLMKERHQLHNVVWITLLLIITGTTDTSLKIISVYGTMNKNLYLFFLFTASFVFTLVWISIQRRKVNWESILMGFGLGIPNQLSSQFFLKGLESVPASIAYPLVASGIVFASIVCDSVFWKRTFSSKQRVAFAMLIIGIILLNLNGSM